MTPDWLLRFAAEAYDALRNRERDPVEDAERQAHFQTQKKGAKE